MASNLYEAGIVITADTQAASAAISGLIVEISRYEESARTLDAIRGVTAGGGDADDAGGAAPGTAGDAEEAAEAMRQLTAGTDAASASAAEFGAKSSQALKLAMSSTGELTLELEEAQEEFKVLGVDARQFGNDMKDVGEFGSDVFNNLKEGALGLVGTLTSIGSAIEGAIGGGLFQLDQQAARLHGRLGQGEEAAQGFVTAVTGLTDATGIAPEIIGDLAYNMRSSNLVFAEADGQFGKTEETLSHMVGTLGMSVEEVTTFAGRAKIMGASVVGLTNTVAKFEKQFNVPELMEELPGIMDDVIKTQAKYGKFTVRDSRTTSVAIARLAGVYSKALGYTAARAAKAAREQFAAFAGEVSSYEDVFLGLSDNFSPLQTAFLEVGMSVNRMGSLMKQAQTQPFAVADAVDQIGRRFGENSFMYRRFHKQLLAGLPEEQRMLQLRIESLQAEGKSRGEIQEILAGENKARDDAAKKQKAFDQAIKGMRNNVVEFYQIFQSLIRGIAVGIASDQDATETIKEGFKELQVMAKAAGKTIGQLIQFFKGNDDALSEHGETLQRVAGFVRDLFGKDNEGRASSFKKVIKGVIVATVGFGTALGIVMGVLGPMMAIIKPLWGIVKGLGKTLLKFGKGIITSGKGAGKLGGTMKVLSAVFKKIALPIGIVLSLFDGFKDRIGDIGKAIEDGDWGKVLDEVLGGLWDSVDSFLLGLPGKFIEGFKNVGRGVETEGSESAGKAVGKVLGKIIKTVIDWFKNDFWPAFEGAMTLENVINAADGLLHGFAAVGDQIIGFFKGVFIGFMEAFGMGNARAKYYLAVLKKSFYDTLDIIGMAFSSLWYLAKEGFYLVVGGVTKGLAILDMAWSTAWGGMKMFVLSQLDTITTAVGKMVAEGLGRLKTLMTAFRHLPGVGKWIKSIGKAQRSVIGLTSSLKTMISEEKGVIAERIADSKRTYDAVNANITKGIAARAKGWKKEKRDWADRKRERKRAVKQAAKEMVEAETSATEDARKSARELQKKREDKELKEREKRAREKAMKLELAVAVGRHEAHAKGIEESAARAQKSQNFSGLMKKLQSSDTALAGLTSQEFDQARAARAALAVARDQAAKTKNDPLGAHFAARSRTAEQAYRNILFQVAPSPAAADLMNRALAEIEVSRVDSGGAGVTR